MCSGALAHKFLAYPSEDSGRPCASALKERLTCRTGAEDAQFFLPSETAHCDAGNPLNPVRGLRIDSLSFVCEKERTCSIRFVASPRDQQTDGMQRSVFHCQNAVQRVT